MNKPNGLITTIEELRQLVKEQAVIYLYRKWDVHAPILLHLKLGPGTKLRQEDGKWRLSGYVSAPGHESTQHLVGHCFVNEFDKQLDAKFFSNYWHAYAHILRTTNDN